MIELIFFFSVYVLLSFIFKWWPWNLDYHWVRGIKQRNMEFEQSPEEERRTIAEDVIREHFIPRKFWNAQIYDMPGEQQRLFRRGVPAISEELKQYAEKSKEKQ